MGRLSKKKDQEEELDKEITQEAVNRFREKYNECGGEIKFMVKFKALRVNEYGGVSVLRHDFLKGKIDPVTGLNFDTDMPFTLYRKVQNKMDDQDMKREYAERMMIYRNTGEMPANPGWQELKEKTDLLFNAKKV